jgi:hypothetical protein
VRVGVTNLDRLDPVLPVGLYTGLSSWPALPRVAELVKEGEEFVGVIPDFDPLYVNLPEVAPATLEGAGPLGWVLELIQQRQAGPQEFRALVVRVVQRLEEMPVRERLRWLELLSYIRALVYHDRERSEQDELREVIAGSVRSDERRREVENMFRSGADVLIEQGRREGRQEGRQEGAIKALQQTVLNLLRAKFGRVPRATVKAIRATEDQAQLDAWATRTLTATTLEDMGIGPGA